jgi:hypothetical protein
VTKHYDGGPAFPDDSHPAMSLRDWFAGLAMQAFISSYPRGYAGHAGRIAEDAYDYADAMLEARAGVNS